MELPDALLRETKAFAARRGLSLRRVIVEALAQKLKVEHKQRGEGGCTVRGDPLGWWQSGTGDRDYADTE